MNLADADPTTVQTPGAAGPATTALHGPPLQWANHFAALRDGFFTALDAQPVPDPHWVAQSAACADVLGLPADWWHRPDWQALQVCSGNARWAGMQPLASVYSGHQFGVWAGQLGDGRALLLGEVQTATGGLEVQLKGSGLTPYSRMGDGRAVLRSSIREFLCSEAMHALGIPTTRALCVTASPLPVRRETLETAAVLTRVAPSFIRFGHFEHFSHQREGRLHGQLRTLADFVIDRFYPQCRDAAVPAAGTAAGGGRTHRHADGAVAGCGLLPRRDEHRQHVGAGADHRLRPVRFSRCLRARPHLQPQ